MDKKRIISYIVAIIIILTFPIVTFYVLSLYLISIGIPALDPIFYVISAMTGFSTICFRIAMEIWQSKTSRLGKIISIFIMFASPLIGYYSFSFVTPVPITIEHFARAMFGYIFGISIGAGYELMKPKKS